MANITRPSSVEDLENEILEALPLLRHQSSVISWSAGYTLNEKLNNLEKMRGGTYEQQINRAALSLRAGKERFLAVFDRIPQIEEDAPREEFFKLIGLKMLERHLREDPDMLNPETENEMEMEEFCNTADGMNSEVKLFLLGVERHLLDENDPAIEVSAAAWKLAQESPRLRGWYHVFFDGEPAFAA